MAGKSSFADLVTAAKLIYNFIEANDYTEDLPDSPDPISDPDTEDRPTFTGRELRIKRAEPTGLDNLQELLPLEVEFPAPILPINLQLGMHINHSNATLMASSIREGWAHIHGNLNYRSDERAYLAHHGIDTEIQILNNRVWRHYSNFDTDNEKLDDLRTAWIIQQRIWLIIASANAGVKTDKEEVLFPAP